MKFLSIWTYLCAVLAIGGIIFNFWDDISAHPFFGGQKQASPGYFEVLSVVGNTEISRAGGSWTSLRIGEEILVNDVVQTGDFSNIIIRIDTSILEIKHNTRLSLDQIRPDSFVFKLYNGRIGGEVRRFRKKNLVFITENSPSRAIAQRGEFIIFADGNGLIGAVSYSGRVHLEKNDERLAVRSGRQSAIIPGIQPTLTYMVPERVQLSLHDVKFSGSGRDSRAIIRGRTDIGAIIRSGGESVPADYDGRFKMEIPVNSDQTEIKVIAEDASGNIGIASASSGQQVKLQ